jgi:hypothetical protein
VAYALVLLPFFVFDYWFYVVDPLLTSVGLLDALGNILMLALCYLGWRALDTKPIAGNAARSIDGVSSGPVVP